MLKFSFKIIKVKDVDFKERKKLTPETWPLSDSFQLVKIRLPILIPD